MNPLRTTTDTKKMRTTAQELIIPGEQTFYLRPIQSKLDIDFWRINQNKDDLWVEILSNRVMRKPKNPDVVMAEEEDPYAELAKTYGSVKPKKKPTGFAALAEAYGSVKPK